MSCTDFEALLLERELEPLLDHPHVQSCEACQHKLMFLLESSRALQSSIHQFAGLPVDFSQSIERGQSRPSIPRRTAMSALIQATAIAASVALTASAVTYNARQTVPAEAPVDSPCADLEALTSPALQGALTEEQVDCLATRRDSDDPDATSASKLLLVDAWERGEKDRWISLAETHIDHVDRGDVDLLYKVALYASKTGDHTRTERSAERALTLAANWPLDVQPQRRYNLWRLRVGALAKLRASDEGAQSRLDEVLPGFVAAGREIGKDETETCLKLTQHAEQCR